MELKGEIAARYVRIVALVALFLGLGDAALLLGVSSGAESPMAALGLSSFIYLMVFCLARLFAAVGLWIQASWGSVLLLGATIIELGLYLFGNPDVRISALGFAIRVVLVLSILVLYGLQFRLRQVND